MDNYNDRNEDNRDINDFKMFEGMDPLEREAELLRSGGKLSQGKKDVARVEIISRLHRDALEGSHLVVTGENVIDFMKDYLAMLGRRRMVALVEGLRMFKGSGVGYYQGGVASGSEKSLLDMLEEVHRRKFVKTILLVDVINEMNLDVLAILDEMIVGGVQVIAVISDDVEVDEESRLMGEELVGLLKRRMRENYRWGRGMLSDM